jgi:hypothetical protein
MSGLMELDDGTLHAARREEAPLVRVRGGTRVSTSTSWTAA